MIPLSAPSPSAWEDLILVWRLRAGSAAALARIYEKHRHCLLRVAGGLLGDRALAEDVVQDVFLRVVRTPEMVRGNGNLRSFLCTCVANHARNAHRCRQTQTARTEADPDLLPDEAAGPARWMLRDDRTAALENALARLPGEQREAVVLHLQGGLRFREIAAATGVPVNTVQSRYRYGLEKLRIQLKGVL